MRLRRLELQGFKSFLDRTILTFEPGITGVVGPNGCGKSNIVDAIQWVMGEQSAKHLRGDSMTDVIFNGSDTRAATSMAEVSLILTKDGVALAPQFSSFDNSDEISITRRVYRDGAGEYLINKTQCRLRDIHELFMDTGVGKRAYSIIEQGQIDRMINVKPEDRRHLFEEVAGITKYKVKRREAEKKLEATRQNMLRLNDILTELEKQMRSLKVQASRAKKYRELKTELEILDLYILGRDLSIHKKEIERLTEIKNQLINQKTELDAKFAALEAEETQLEVARIDQEKAYQEFADKERELAEKIQQTVSELGVLEERMHHLSQTLESSKTEEQELQETLQQLEEQEATTERERLQSEETLRDSDQSLSLLQEGLSEKQTLSRRELEKKQEIIAKSSHVSHRKVVLQNLKETAQSRTSELETKQQTLDEKAEALKGLVSEHRERLTSLDGKVEDCVGRSKSAEADAVNIHHECQDLSSRLSTAEEVLYQARDNFHSQKSRLASLEELQNNFEGYSSTAREILLKLDESNVQAVPLAELIEPDAELDDHLEALLGLDMNTLVVRTNEEAERVIRLVSEKSLERVKILSLESLDLPQAASVEGLTPILSRLRVREGFENAVRWKLGKTFLCPDSHQLFELRKTTSGVTLISLDNRTIGHEDRALSGGTTPIRIGVFARRREISELSTTLSTSQTDLDRLTTERENMLQQLQTQEQLHRDLRDKLSSIHVENVELRKEREKAQLEFQRAERDLQGVDQETQHVQRHIQELAQQIVAYDNEEQELLAQEAQLTSEIASSDSRAAELESQVQLIIHQVSEKKIERSRLEERVTAYQARLAQLKNSISSETTHLAQVREERLNAEEELERAETQKTSLGETKLESEEIHRDLLVRLSDLKEAFQQTCTQLADSKSQKTSMQTDREQVTQSLQDSEIKLMQSNSSFEHLCGISLERYQKEPTPIGEEVSIDIETLPLFKENLEVEWAYLLENEKKALLDEHLKNIREKIGRYGEVNLTAIQEYEEIEKRNAFLNEQKNDLEKSIQILEQAIVKIEETTTVRFQETFNAVNEKFKEIFPILFNGGKAELTLLQSPENPNEIGIDVMAQPPGKRLQSITLLSGGEKALTAVSLVLSIFARKPSPFCLLDEVDAPLDDANVSRFNTVIAKMAEKTQFIVITHNKKTMEIAEALYGVTMEKPGISKMTSVRLN